MAWPSLRSAERAAGVAAAAGFSIDILAVLDRPDAITREVFENWKYPALRIMEVDYGDLGLSRNAGAKEATGDYIAFLDADDLWGETWLQQGLKAAVDDDRDIVWHPQLSIYFGSKRNIFLHIDMESAEFEMHALAAANYWTALCLAKRNIFLETPYPKPDIASGLGFEDWSWNRQTIEAGIIHKTVPNTGHLIRAKPVSLSQRTASAGAIAHPTQLFRKLLKT